MYKCQYCANLNISEVLNLGALPPVNDLRPSTEQLEVLNCFPLPFCHCEKCGLTQIGVTLDREVVFPKTYPYLSGMTRSLLDNFAIQAQDVNSYLQLGKNDLVIDIGSNDGSLLANYSSLSRVLGIEPTQAAGKAIERGIPTLNMYFDFESASIVNEKYGKARLVTACNVFAHIDDIPSLISNLDQILAEDGIFVSESHYLLNLIETLQFDTIYHEHLRYYTVSFLSKLFQSNGFEIFRVDPTPSHGGSIRVWTSRIGKHRVTSSVQDYLELEQKANITNFDTLKKFAKDVITWRNNFRFLLSELISEGAVIGGLGAPSRASTLIAFAGITELDLVGVGEVSDSAKLGKNMPGTRIQVITEAELLSRQPSHLLILSWHIKDGIMAALRDKGYLGKFIVPLPNPVVVE